MKNLVTLLVIIFASGLSFAQMSDNPAIGVRIGNGNSGKFFIPGISSLNMNTVVIESEGERIKSYMVYDENESLVLSKEISKTFNAVINTEALNPGFYYIAVVSESGNVVMNTYMKP